MLSVIMAGGVGERFWPRSRRATPKQLLDLTGQGSMLRLTVERTARFSSPDEIFIITNVDQAAAVAREVGSLVASENIVGEPVGRNTAATVGLAAALIDSRFGDVPFIVLPADHLVADAERYATAVRAAEDYVRTHDALLTFGIQPSRPETGYGYIKVGERLESASPLLLCRAESFHEKPDAETARHYVDNGSYYWNSGMFFWRPRVVLSAIHAHLPELYKVIETIGRRMGTEPLASVLKNVYAQCPSISVDYGIMEKADSVVVLRGDFYWNDVGSWESIRDVYPKDAAGNVLVGRHFLINSSENTVFSPDRTVGLIGVDGVVVVDSGDAILVCDRENAQQVRDLVAIIKRHRQDLV